MSLREAAEIEEFRSDDPFSALDNVRIFCGEHQVRCVPAFDVGELEDSRYFSLEKSEDVFEEAISKALEDGESHTVEFKASSFLDVVRLTGGHFDTQDQLISAAVEHEVVKTLTGFMNADGGVLLIGVNDDHSIYGIENEFNYINGAKKDKDGWGLRLSGKLEKTLLEYREVVGYVQQCFVERDQKQICAMIVVPRRDRLVACLSEDLKSEVSYQRAGNRTNKLTPHAIEGIIRQRLAQQ